MAVNAFVQKMIPGFVVLAAGILLGQSAKSAPLFDLEVLSMSGELDSSGNTISGYLPESVSVNDAGKVAFVASSNLGQSIYISDGSSAPEIVSFSNPTSTRTYSNGVQINNCNQIVARDNSSGTSLIRVWEGNVPGSFTVIARGSTSGGTPTFPAAYSSVFSHPALSNIPDSAANPFVVFSALDIELPLPDTVIATPKVYGATARSNFNELRMAAPLRPVVADNGKIVVRVGSQTNDPIRLYSNDLSNSWEVAVSAHYSRLGRSPGISDDGRIVAFYGELTTAGAAALGLQLGPGIFARVEQEGTTAQILRVAGIAGNGRLDPGETYTDLNSNGRWDAGEQIELILSYEPDSRVSANNEGAICFLANDFPSGVKGLYTARLEFLRADPDAESKLLVASLPRLVAQVGEAVESVGTISNIAVFDPLNGQSGGQMAFWAAMADGGQAIILATPNCKDSTYTNPIGNPYINQYNAGTALNLPRSSTSTGGVNGGNSCGAASLSMLLNTFKFAAHQPQRAMIWSASDFGLKSGHKSIYGLTALTKPIPVTAQNNVFSFIYAKNLVINSMGYTGTEGMGLNASDTVGTAKAWLDDKLSAGIPVIVSTSFSSKPRNSANPHGGGHVILFVGRTLKGDYIVKDPAGDYYAGDDGSADHYGLGVSCGSYAVYKQSDVKERLAKRVTGGGLVTPANTPTTDIDAATARPALAIPAIPYPAPVIQVEGSDIVTLDGGPIAYDHPTSAEADPAGLCVIGNFSNLGDRPYFLWVEDSEGRVSGWLPNGSFVEEIPGSSATLNPLIPSDPDQDDTGLIAASAWPYAISINNAQSKYKIFVQATEDTDYSVDAVWFLGDRNDVVANEGTMTTSEIKQFEISPPGAIPLTMPLAITSFRSLGSRLFEVSLKGGSSASYEFRSSQTMDFSPGTLVEDLAKGDPGDPGEISGANSSVVTTDASGEAKVRMVLQGVSNFVRAQSSK